MSSAAILDDLLRSPELPGLVRQLNDVLAAERERREVFRRGLTGEEKAEFINGEVIVHSPAKLRHLRVSNHLFKLLDTFVVAQRLGMAAHEKALVCLSRNDYEPDICFFGSSKAAELRDDTMEFPAPDFIAEVLSPSTEARDRGVKFRDYAMHRVGEYWIVDPESETIEQYKLSGTEYGLIVKPRDGTISSHTVRGFAIPVRAVFDPEENQKALFEMVAKLPRGN